MNTILLVLAMLFSFLSAYGGLELAKETFSGNICLLSSLNLYSNNMFNYFYVALGGDGYLVNRNGDPIHIVQTEDMVGIDLLRSIILFSILFKKNRTSSSLTLSLSHSLTLWFFFLFVSILFPPG